VFEEKKKDDAVAFDETVPTFPLLGWLLRNDYFNTRKRRTHCIY